MQTTDFRYRPQGATLGRFHASDAFARFVMGPLGSGKTTACCVEIYRRACAQAPGPDGMRRTRWFVIRNTYPDLETTTIKSWRGIFDERFGRFTMGHPPVHRMRFTLDDGTRVACEVIFLALDREDHVRKLRGAEATGIWLNEAKEIAKPILDMTTARVGRYPPRLAGGPSWSGVIGDSNPPDEDHWYFRMAEEARPEGWAFFRQPGAAIRGRDGAWRPNLAAENLRNLPDGYYSRQLAGKPDEWIKVFIGGEYGFVIDGKRVYPDYADGLHCRAVAPIPGRPIYVGADFGLTPAAVVGQVAPDGQVRWLDELVTEDMGAVRFAELLNAKLQRDFAGFALGRAVGDPSGDSRAQTDERTVFDILRARGLPFEPAPSNDPTLRIEAVSAPLRRLIDGAPGLLLDPRCARLRKGMMGGYQYRRLAVAGDDRYRDVPDKNRFSHVCEAAQYLNLGLGEGRALLRRAKPSSQLPVHAEGGYAIHTH